MGEERPESFLLPRPIYPLPALPSLRLLSRAPSTTFQGPGTHILHWGRHAKEIPAAVGYGRGSKSNSGRPSPLAPTHKRSLPLGPNAFISGVATVYGEGHRETDIPSLPSIKDSHPGPHPHHARTTHTYMARLHEREPAQSHWPAGQAWVWVCVSVVGALRIQES